jgi:uncharacterized protein YraI
VKRLLSTCLRVACAAVLALACATAPAGAAASAPGQTEFVQLYVTDAYLELHEGPGRGYAVTQVVPRGDAVEVLYRRTDWFRVRTGRGIEGWATARELATAKFADGSAFVVPYGDREGFRSHRWELGAFAGDYGGATLISGYLSRSLNEYLAAELTLSQFLGNASNGYLVDLGLTHVVRPDWRISPFVSLGTGLVYVEPKATLVRPLDRTDQTAYAAVGARYYWTRRFFVRAEYRTQMVFTSRDENEEIDSWKIGLAFFF